MDKENVVYSATKKNEMISFAGKWVELAIIMLSEIARHEKDNTARFSHMQNLDFFLKSIKVEVGLFGKRKGTRG
jgi:hypothetical protein